MGTRVKLEGTTINDLYVAEYLGNNYYRCVCTRCGRERVCRTYELTCKKYMACKECEEKDKIDKLNKNLFEKLANIDTGYIRVIGVNAENHKKADYICTLCNRKFETYITNILRGTKSCSECSNKLKMCGDLTQKKFATGRVTKYLGMSKWSCICGNCGSTITRITTKLMNQDHILCNKCSGILLRHNIKPGQVFGNWETIEYVPDTTNYHNKWLCKCRLCGKVSEVFTYNLVSGHSKSCGCTQLIDLKGKYINELYVIEYVGNGYWKCRCSCGKELNVLGYELRSENIKSCGCKKSEYAIRTTIERYGEIQPNKKVPRNTEQLNAVMCRENLLKYIKDQFGDIKPYTSELADKLGIGICNTLRNVHKYELENYVEIGGYTSRPERDILNFVKSLVGEDAVKTKNRTILKGKELDIYIPDKKLAIELNGVYWHSTVYKDVYYHRDKSINCIKSGIRLIHIFENEWADTQQQSKIKNILRSALGIYDKKIGARECDIRQIDFSTAKDFLNNYHMQGGGATSSVNLGCYKDNTLLGVMTLNTPRYDTKYEWEIIRECWLPGVLVIGGASKFFNFFIRRYNPTSVISYCDATKFTGAVYFKLGFKLDSEHPITEPNYVWVKVDNEITFTTLTRYQTQKKDLVERGLGTADQTENEIMENLDYFKLYNSGNLRFVWNKNQ